MLESVEFVPKGQPFIHFGCEFDSCGHEACPRGGKGVMRSGQFKRLVRLGTGALMVVLFHGVCAPSPARASCSHPIGTSSPLVLSLHRLDELIMTGSSSVSEDGLVQPTGNESVPMPRVPCSGLSCSGRVPLPVSTASLVHDRADQWGTLEMRVVLDKSSQPAKTRDGASLHSVSQNTSIFHPPPV